jgi:aminopeptidase N
MKKLVLFALILIALSACKTNKPTNTLTGTQTNTPKENEIVKVPEPVRYNPSRTFLNDLIHTKLDVRFDFEKAHLLGRATLSFKPYFYPQNNLVLDAKGFDIHKVALYNPKTKSEEQDLKYDYNGKQLNIILNKTYTAKDTFYVYIEYTAKPEELENAEGSAAITSAKGLYFINPKGEDKYKPTQIWTQGETEANSCWFPTIDSPNEKHTQELYITVDKKYVTLSNGKMLFSTDNGDGTRTDYWRQDLPHAPYLTMMAIGEYAIVKDKWRDKEVNYYVERDFGPHAKKIFEHTPEMIEFFSKKMGYDFPWDKYHQVVVRDYVSGAMENTSAVIFGEFVQKTSRELLDGNNESIVAHELFHHWFGDLVTCESWANLPLNESFATYGEYLWFENKYGRDEADYHGQNGLNTYLLESRQKQVNMIRFDYLDKEDMFDSHSYAKGGRILHMLRYYMGDEAFFKSLELYLKQNAYKAAEMHHFRLACEEVTGEDLNWFFNQWFYASGHPNIEIETAYNDIDKKVDITIKQKQDFSTTPLYRLPIDVDVYVNGKKERTRLTFTKAVETLSIPCERKPDLVNVDAEKMLLCTKKEKKTADEWAFQYRNAPLYLDRFEALENISKGGNAELTTAITLEALKDKHWNIRAQAIRSLRKTNKATSEEVKTILFDIAQNDQQSSVRAAALKYLSQNFKGGDVTTQFQKSLQDSSYMVMGEALNALADVDETKVMQEAKKLESEKIGSIINTIAGIYARIGSDEQNDFYLNSHQYVNSFSKFSFVSNYNRFLKRCKDETVIKGLALLEDVASNEGAWWMRLSGVQALGELYSLYGDRIFEMEEKQKKPDVSDTEKTQLSQQISSAKKTREEILTILKRLKEKETDKNLVKFLSNY